MERYTLGEWLKWWIRPLGPQDEVLRSATPPGLRELEPYLAKFAGPRTEDERFAVVQRYLALRKYIAFGAFIATTAFGLYAILRPGESFRLAAKAVLYATPVTWLGSIICLIAYRQREQHAINLRQIRENVRAWYAAHPDAP